MIRINLLPPEMESAPSHINPAIPLSIAVIIPALVLAPIHLGQMAARRRLQTETASLKSELERYQPIIAQVESLEALAEVQLSQRKSIIQQLETERLRYPQFLDDFLKLLPGNLWLTNLTTIGKPDSALAVNLDVTALDNYAIADLVANLETSQLFSEVDLGAIAISNAPTGQSMTFHITTNYRKAASVPDANKKS